MHRCLTNAFLFAVALTGCASPPSQGHRHEEPSAVVEGAREIQVRAAHLRFDPDELKVAAGEDVTIVLTAADVAHDFTVQQTDVHVGADAGQTAAGGLRIDEPGTYTYVCTLPGHAEAGMRGTLTVTEA